MFVTELSLTDFRNYETAQLELTDGVTVFVGSNGRARPTWSRLWSTCRPCRRTGCRRRRR